MLRVLLSIIVYDIPNNFQTFLNNNTILKYQKLKGTRNYKQL